MTANVIHFANAAIANDQIDRGTMILYIQPVAHILALTVDRRLFVRESVNNH